jgi:hypothetical protein
MIDSAYAIAHYYQVVLQGAGSAAAILRYERHRAGRVAQDQCLCLVLLLRPCS